MKGFIITFFISLSLAGELDTSQVKRSNIKEPLTHIPSIPELPSSIKDPAIWKNGTRLIFFYTPWCTYSQAMKPLLYELIEKLYYNNVSDILVGQIDVSINSDVARTFRIKSTPTLLLFRNGTRYEFIEDMSLDNLVSFVMKVLTHSLIEVNSTSELESYLEEYSVIFLLVHDEEIHDDWQLVYERVSTERTLISQFFYTTNSDIVNDMGFSLSELPGVVVFKDSQLYQYKEDLSKYRMTLWVESEQFPALPTADSSTLRYYVSTGLVKRLGILIVSAEERRSIKEKKAYEVVKQIALSRKLHSGYQFITVQDMELAEKILPQTVKLPTLFIWEHHTGFYYLFEAAYTKKNVTSFLFSITAGKVEPHGGPGFMSVLYYWYWWTYSLIQIMLSHHPILSVVSVTSLLTGLVLCFMSYRNRRKINPKRKEAIERAKQREMLKRQRRKKEKEDNQSDENSDISSVEHEKDSKKDK